MYMMQMQQYYISLAYIYETYTTNLQYVCVCVAVLCVCMCVSYITENFIVKSTIVRQLLQNVSTTKLIYEIMLIEKTKTEQDTTIYLWLFIVIFIKNYMHIFTNVYKERYICSFIQYIYQNSQATTWDNTIFLIHQNISFGLLYRSFRIEFYFVDFDCCYG